MYENKIVTLSCITSQTIFNTGFMRIFFVYTLFIISTLISAGQSYKKLWQDAEQAAKNDLPTTTIHLLHQIKEHAQLNGDKVQELKACIKLHQQYEKISVDSASQCLAEMERHIATERDTVMCVLWHQALMKIYARANTDTTGVSAFRRHLDASLQPFELLGRTALAPYEDLFECGNSDAYFNKDLLSPIAREVFSHLKTADIKQRNELYARLIKHYRNRGNRKATLLWTLDSIKHAPRSYEVLPENPNYKALCKVAEEFSDLSLNAQTYLQFLSFTYLPQTALRDSIIMSKATEGVRLYRRTNEVKLLKKHLAELQLAQVEINGMPHLLYPDEMAHFVVEGKNLKRAELRLYRLGINAADCHKLQKGNAQWKKYRQGQPTIYNINTPALPPYQVQDDTLHISVGKSGIYECAVFVNGKWKKSDIMHVSSVRPMWINVGNDSVRVVLLDAKSGKVEIDGEIAIFGKENMQKGRIYPDKDGFFYLHGEVTGLNYFPKVNGDEYMLPFTPTRDYYGSYGNHTTRSETCLQLFADRAIYRPGQTIRIAGVVFTKRGDDYHTESKFPITLRLYDVNRKEIQKWEVISDEMGNFSEDLTLPKECLTGYFSVVAQGKGGQSTSLRIRVEEYKRPTFTATVNDPREAYALGDTVTLEGNARSYTDLPVVGAKVKWHLNRTAWHRTEQKLYETHGECVTDENGKFLIPAYLCGDAENKDFTHFQRYFYTINYDVTAENGETTSGSIVLQAGTKSYWLDANWPDVVCRENTPQLQVNCFNAAGKAQEKELQYTLWKYDTNKSGALADSICVATGSLIDGRPVSAEVLANASSGKYAWKFSLTENEKVIETLRKDFILFSETDTKVTDSSVFWHHIRHSEKQDSAYVMIGSACDSITLFCDKFANGKLLESQRTEFSDSIVKFNLFYHPSYGESARWCFAFIKDGEVYTFSVDILKPAPEKRLCLNWETFRSYLTPGQKEEWRLSVKYPNGKPAEASVLGRMYDASLDAFLRQDWRFSNIAFPRRLNYRYWNWAQFYNSTLFYHDTLRKTYNYTPLSFAHWDNSIFYDEMEENMLYQTALPRVKMSATRQTSMDRSNVMGETYMAKDMVLESSVTTSSSTIEVKPRTNFAETAFFYPNLKTDETGCVKICFTLPQSLTTWRFDALAHTSHMDYASLDTTIVARKEFMVQPSLPRFARSGDRFAVPVTLTNLSQQSLYPNVVLTIVNEATGKEIFIQEKRDFIEVNGSKTLTFECEVPHGIDPTLWICRVTAQSEHFKDGEEHYLPILSDRVEVSRSIPFTIFDKGSQTIQLDSLLQAEGSRNHTLTIDVTSHPTWTAVQALPVLTDKRCYGARDWATQYYALEMAKYIAHAHPAIKEAVIVQKGSGKEIKERNLEGLDSNTPWLPYAEREAKRGEELSNLFDDNSWAVKMATAYEQLKAHQNQDGSWSWFKGMQGNFTISLDIAILLARADLATHNAKSQSLLNSTIKFLDAEVSKQVEILRSNRKEVNSPVLLTTSQINYLYLYAISGRTLKKEGEYLLQIAEENIAKYAVNVKPRLAVIMAKYGEQAQVETLIKSLDEYMVESPTMGKYYDGKKMQDMPQSQRLFMQTATLEAMGLLKNDFCDEIEKIRLNLMQSLRTQVWEGAPSVTDALHALLLPTNGQTNLVKDLGKKSTLYYTLCAGKQIVDAPSDKNYATALGSYKKVYDKSNSSLFTSKGEPKKEISLKLRQNSEGLAWGYATATFTQPLAEVKSAGTGFEMDAVCEVLREGKWEKVNDKTMLAVGERIRLVMNISADRAYEFVRIALQHPCGIVPVRSLSGYAYSGNLWAYRAVSDTETLHFIEEIKKGKSIYVEEYLVNRTGEFQFGTMQIQCLIAPEFSSYSTLPFKTISAE